jgi:predicted ester cyclase
MEERRKMLSIEEQNKDVVRRLYASSTGVSLAIEGNVISNPQYTVEDMIAEGDKVVVRFTMVGTRQGRSSSISPIHGQISTAGIAIYRIVNGKIAEHWVNLDRLGLLDQLRAAARVEQAVA